MLSSSGVKAIHHFKPVATPQKCGIKKQKVWPLIKVYTFGLYATILEG